MSRIHIGLLLLALCSLVEGREDASIERTSNALRQPLSARVTESTVASLIEFAVRDRECRAVLEHPYGMHGPIYEAYSDCMYASKRTACDGSAEDFATVKTLFSRDPRLARLLDFDTFAYQLQSDCEARGSSVSLGRIMSWKAEDLQQCSVEPQQPVLVAAAITLKVYVPADDNGDFLAMWGATCRGVKGIFFLNEHCRKVQSQAKEVHSAYSSLVRPFTRPAEFGVEDYLCPMLYEYWNPR